MPANKHRGGFVEVFEQWPTILNGMLGTMPIFPVKTSDLVCLLRTISFMALKTKKERKTWLLTSAVSIRFTMLL